MGRGHELQSPIVAIPPRTSMKVGGVNCWIIDYRKSCWHHRYHRQRIMHRLVYWPKSLLSGAELNPSPTPRAT